MDAVQCTESCDRDVLPQPLEHHEQTPPGVQHCAQPTPSVRRLRYRDVLLHVLEYVLEVIFKHTSAGVHIHRGDVSTAVSLLLVASRTTGTSGSSAPVL